LLRDPTDEHVVPVVEELQRRLPKEYLGGQQDAEAAEEDGMLD
jgi:magnesium transporter